MIFVKCFLMLLTMICGFGGTCIGLLNPQHVAYTGSFATDDDGASRTDRVINNFPGSIIIQGKYGKANIAISDAKPQRGTSNTTKVAQIEARTNDSDRTSPFEVRKPIYLTFLALIIFILLPFLPGIAELLRPKDEKALALNMNFTRDYEYFGNSFRKILENGLRTEHITDPGRYIVGLSKPEKVRVTKLERASDNETIDEILYVLLDFTSGSYAQFNKEIYVKGRSTIGERNTLRALYCEDDIVIGEGTAVVRWVAGNNDIEIKESCRLGISVAAHRRLSVARSCSFNRMFGLPIATYKSDLPEVPFPNTANNISDSAIVITKEGIYIPPLMKITQDVVTHHKIVLREKSVTEANIKSYSDIIVERGSRVEGNLHSEGNVIIETGCTIVGNVFAQGYVQLGNAIQVGQEGHVKSVIGKKGITVKANVNIYGYVMAEGKGKIL